MAKELRERFESLDYLRKNEAFAEYRAHYDELDPVIKENNLKKFICKMPLNRDQRRGLLKSINTPIE